MTRHVVLLAAFLAALVIVGCSGTEEPTKPPTPKPTAKVGGEETKAPTGVSGAAEEAARKAAEEAAAKKTATEEAAKKAAEEAAAKKAATEEAAKKAADEAAAAKKAAEEAAAKAAADTTQQTQSLLAQIMEWIKSGKLSEADAQLKVLESKAGSLSPALQEKIKAARSALTAAQKAPSVPGGLPSLPK